MELSRVKTLELIHRALDSEIESIHHFRRNLDERIIDAVHLIFGCKGKTILAGVGKSGDIAKKISSTLSSTGTPAIFLHPTDALHGDAGIIGKDDIVFAIGKSGESEELNSLIPTIKKIGARLISLTANENSTLARSSHVCVVTPILREACPLALAPTSSTTIALMVGDAIAMALMELRNFRAEDFALYHPGGRLGKRLALKVDDVMRIGDKIPKVTMDQNVYSILDEISLKAVGATTVTDDNSKLIGLITDYDIRRMLQKGFNPEFIAKDFMNSEPTFFLSGTSAYDILVNMEDRSRPVSVAPIVNKDNIVIGIITVHDLLQKGL
ncbi:MAG: KpsF/GutQ family sugar-phosphate isomerase [Leptospira sp.]|nr:KpsF/GutQ family sugar-phosphate isomerase [Leptospira sp.]